MRVLLFGANGQVGSECQKVFQKMGWNVLAFTRKDADFSKPDAVYAKIKDIKPDVVVNACAYTAVDKAESESELANLVNAESVGAMGKACNELEIPTIHISTDYVFNGTAKAPYKEDASVAPMGVYGQSKLAGEQKLQVENPKHIILRTSWVFSANGNNFVKTMLRLGAERDELGVVGDQFGCPTYAGDIAESIAGVLVSLQEDKQFSAWGLYNCSNSGACSWYDFALATFKAGVQAELLLKAPKVNSINTNQYPTPTARPAYSVLDCTKLEALLGKTMPHWQIGLSEVCIALR
jgi:dTDP-4-dehydrorhamnose reductase